jgi:hypothetical protein
MQSKRTPLNTTHIASPYAAQSTMSDALAQLLPPPAPATTSGPTTTTTTTATSVSAAVDASSPLTASMAIAPNFNNAELHDMVQTILQKQQSGQAISSDEHELLQHVNQALANADLDPAQHLLQPDMHPVDVMIANSKADVTQFVDAILHETASTLEAVQQETQAQINQQRAVWTQQFNADQEARGDPYTRKTRFAHAARHAPGTDTLHLHTHVQLPVNLGDFLSFGEKQFDGYCLRVPFVPAIPATATVDAKTAAAHTRVVSRDPPTLKHTLHDLSTYDKYRLISLTIEKQLPAKFGNYVVFLPGTQPTSAQTLSSCGSATVYRRDAIETKSAHGGHDDNNVVFVDVDMQHAADIGMFDHNTMPQNHNHPLLNLCLLSAVLYNEISAHMKRKTGGEFVVVGENQVTVYLRRDKVSYDAQVLALREVYRCFEELDTDGSAVVNWVQAEQMGFFNILIGNWQRLMHLLEHYAQEARRLLQHGHLSRDFEDPQVVQLIWTAIGGQCVGPDPVAPGVAIAKVIAQSVAVSDGGGADGGALTHYNTQGKLEDIMILYVLPLDHVHKWNVRGDKVDKNELRQVWLVNSATAQQIDRGVVGDDAVADKLELSLRATLYA